MLLRIFCIFFVCLGHLACAQDTLRVNANFLHKYPAQAIRYFKANRPISADSAYQVFKTGSATIKPLSSIHLGIVSDEFWFCLNLKNSEGFPLDLVFELASPHLWRVSFYEFVQDSLVAQSETGTARNFFTRAIKHRNFAMPIPLVEHGAATILVKVHQINSLVVPFELWHESVFYSTYQKNNLQFGIFYGFLFFCSFMAMVVFALVRQQQFGWYAIYIGLACFYLFNDVAFGFQFLFPEYAALDTLIIIQSPLWVFVFMIKFTQSFLETNQYTPRIHRFFNGIAIIFIVYSLLAIAAGSFMLGISHWLLPILYLVLLFGDGLMLWAGWLYTRVNKVAGWLYLGATGSVIGCSIYSVFSIAFGWFETTTLNPLFIGFSIEAILLTIALGLKYRETVRAKIKLSMALSEKESQMYKAYLEGIDRERLRIAGELHDDIGSQLGHIKRTYHANEGSHEAQKALDNVIQDVRSLSHALAPTVARVSGLMPLVESLVADIRKENQIDIKIQKFDYAERLSTDQIIQVYRILQEAFQNIVKHSQAKHADVQFFGYPDQLVITLEDDGVGFDAQRTKGFGINHMTIRTQALRGKIEINSTAGHGCLIVLEVPFQ